MLFDVDEPCNEILIIMHGVIDVVISDGYQNSQVLDILGKGSIIGANFVLKQEIWSYEAINNSSLTVKVIRISHNLISMLASQNQDIMTAV